MSEQQHTSASLLTVGASKEADQMSRIANEQIHHSPTRVPSFADALQQIEAEYREMPGLIVTDAQAQRLWGLDNMTCKRALDALVQRGVLKRTGRDAYIRSETFSSLAADSTRAAPHAKRR
jgi:hypothetical protein